MKQQKEIMATKVKISIPDQVKTALDGRSQRWLALHIAMPEDTMSKKMNGKDGAEFTEEEILAINKRLGSNIKL